MMTLCDGVIVMYVQYYKYSYSSRKYFYSATVLQIAMIKVYEYSIIVQVLYIRTVLEYSFDVSTVLIMRCITPSICTNTYSSSRYYSCV